jgi:hypothetical protein
MVAMLGLVEIYNQLRHPMNFCIGLMYNGFASAASAVGICSSAILID